MVETKKNTYDTGDNIALDALRDKVQQEKTVDFKEENTQQKTDIIIKNANNKFLLEVLSPEIQENEKKKRIHKDWLMIAMAAFLIFQFIIVAIIVVGSGYWIIKSHVTNNPFSYSTLQIIFTFIGAYITSVVVELIAILKYIVKNVFDTSIAGMVNNFREEKTHN